MSETQHTAHAAGDDCIEAAYDSCDGERAFIIADTTTDDAWLAISADQELDVEEWA